MQDSGHNAQPIPHNKGKGPVVPGDVETLANDELSSGSSPSLNLLEAKKTWESTARISMVVAPQGSVSLGRIRLDRGRPFKLWQVENDWK